MIRVVASDLDDTLLNSSSKISEGNIAAIQKAQAAGMKFIAITGRDWGTAMEPLKSAGIRCDFGITASGADVRTWDGTVLSRHIMNSEDLRRIEEVARTYGLRVILVTEKVNYVIGTEEEWEADILDEMRLHLFRGTDEELRATKAYAKRKEIKKRAGSLEEFEKLGIPAMKVFLHSDNTEHVRKARARCREIPSIAEGSSYEVSIELTDVKAQKGLALKELIESEGYAMEEVMVLGDSMNDFSMIHMDFGATVAVENAVDQIKQAARYRTKSNDEDGVAYAIEMAMAGRLRDLMK